MRRKTLKEGFTTGSAVAAAAGKAVRLLLDIPPDDGVDIPLPPFPPEPDEPPRRLTVPVLPGFFTLPAALPVAAHADAALFTPHSRPIVLPLQMASPEELAAPTEAGVQKEGSGSSESNGSFLDGASDTFMCCSVQKDGGDDPDATHGAVIHTAVRLLPGCRQLIVRGGAGVGRVTLPGLAVGVGFPAINPQPQRQLAATIGEIFHAAGYNGGAEVIIAVPEGATRAKRTLNARLGIVDGISILGTRGTVKPFSHSSWKATITQGMDVARAAGVTTIGLSTGRRSERLLMRSYAALPERAFIQVADFVAFSLEEAARKGFARVAWGCFFGKLVKLAQGHAYTHARTAPVDFVRLAHWCGEQGVGAALQDEVARANTAMQVLEIIDRCAEKQAVLDAVTLRAQHQAVEWTRRGGQPVPVTMHLFSFDGELLSQAQN